jgi:hypothetical protein
MKVTSHIHLVPNLSVSGATPLLPTYAFMAWTGATLPLPLPLYICVTGINLAAVKNLKGVLNSVTFLEVFQHKRTLKLTLLGYYAASSGSSSTDRVITLKSAVLSYFAAED